MYKTAFPYIVACGLLMAACSRQPSPSQPSQPAPAPDAVKGRAAASPAQPPVASSQPAAPATATTQAESQTTSKVVASDQTEGPFHVGGQSFTFVKHVQGVNGNTSGDDSTVEWWELRDAAGNAVYRQQYQVNFENGTFADSESVDARELKGRFGQGILVEGGELPSAPNGGWWIQIFGLMNGKLTPLSAPMSADGAFVGEEVETYQPNQMFRGQQPQSISRDVLKFRVWAGNLSIFYSVMIDWIQLRVRPEWTCYRMTTQGRISACRYKVEADPVRGKDLTFVRLFSEPDETFTPRHVVIKPESKID